MVKMLYCCTNPSGHLEGRALARRIGRIFWLGAGVRGFLRVISSAADAEGRSGGGVRPHADAVRVLSLTRRVTL